MSLAKLREGTAVAHRHLEGKFNLFERIRNRESYVAHLRRYHRWLEPLEAELTPHVANLDLDWDRRRRAGRLANDLTALTGSKPSTVETASPVRVASVAQALGTLYVLEGSTLGGQVIAKHLATLADLDSAREMDFYGGRGAETGKMWREFLSFFERYLADHPAAFDEVAHHANLTFASVEAALCET